MSETLSRPRAETADEVLYEAADGVAVITLNRPERMNTISGPMLAQLTELLLKANADKEVRAVILTGAGRAFCAGLDLVDATQGSGIGSPGDYIITGRAKWPVTGLGGDDALFLRVSAGLNLIRANKIYGGPNNEVGWSIAEDGGQGWGQPMGYIICGFTKSPLYWCNDPEDRYLVKTNTTAGSGVSCREKFGSISYAPLSLPLESVDLSYTTTTNRCSPFPSTIVPYSIYPVACNACTPGTRKTPDDLNDGGGHAGDAVAGVESDASANAGAITLFPNPTAGDRGFTIGASFDRAGEGTIVVSDMRGRVVYTATESYEAGRREIPVSTDGWAAGIYMVKLTAPGSVGTARVVVGDK